MKKMKILEKKEVEKRILKFLSEQNMCSISTCSKNSIPRCSMTEFAEEGEGKNLVFYVLTEGKTKLKNLKENPIASVALSKRFKGWNHRIEGTQFTCKVEIGEFGSKSSNSIWEEGVDCYKKKQKYLEKMGLVEIVPKPESAYQKLYVLKFFPSEVSYLDIGLQKEGYSPCQIWKQ